MDARITRLESTVDELARSIGEIEGRLRRLEALFGAGETGAGGAGETGPAPDPRAAASPTTDLTAALTLTGRTLICLAGAYVPRSLTAEGLLPETAGATVGLAYAGAWIAMADRAGARGRTASAAFHGATATLVALPLVWETTTRFGLLSPTAGAAALAILAGLILVVAWRRSLWPVAWLVSVGAALAALLLGGRTHAPAPYAAFLVTLGIATLWLCRERFWKGLRWVMAGFADLGVLLLWAEDPIGQGRAAAGEVLAIQLALFGLYATSFALVARRRGGEVTIGAALQTAAAAAVGYAGAVATAAQHATAAAVLGAASLALALGAYVGAFYVIAEVEKRRVLFVSSLAVPLVLGGGHLLLDRPAVLWSAAAILCSWLGSRYSRLTLSGHATVYALIAAGASGLLARSTQALTASADVSWPAPSPGAVLAFVAIVACLTFKVRGDIAFWGSFARAPKLLLLILGCWAGGGLLLHLAGPLAAGRPGAGADPAIFAAVRTAVLAAAALLLARVGRSPHLQEASWLVYPVLLLGAFKLLVEDFPAGRPETLLVALALYGSALIAAPRLRRGRVDGGSDRP